MRSLFFCATLLVLGSLAPAPAAEIEPWRLMGSLRFAEARAAFNRADPADPLVRLGRAISLLGAQPKTARNLDEAETILAELATTAGEPSLAARAAYLHARLPHVHRDPVDWAEAARRYRHVYETHPDHPLGQRALVRHGIVTLFRPASPDELRQRLLAFVEAAAPLTDPEAQRDLDWLLGSLQERRLLDPAATLAHVERLLASPVPLREVTRLSMLVQAGELARRLNQPAQAARHYREFLSLTQRDGRVFLIRQRLAEMEAAS